MLTITECKLWIVPYYALHVPLVLVEPFNTVKWEGEETKIPVYSHVEPCYFELSREKKNMLSPEYVSQLVTLSKLSAHVIYLCHFIYM